MFKIKDWALNIICIGAIVLVSVPYIINLRVPYLHTDEYGYWGSAAFFAGYDWSNITSTNGYFSYGYGLFLSLLFRLVDNAFVRFKLALVFNSVFIIGLFLVLNQIIDIIYQGLLNNVIKKAVCLAASLYCSVVSYMGITLPECLLTFLYAVNVWLFILYVKKPTTKKELLILLISTYLYMLHQRTIVIMILNIAVIVVRNVFFDKKSLYNKIFKFLIICCGVIVLFVGCECLKNIVQSNVWLTKNNVISSTVNANDYSGIWIKVKYLFSVEGIKSFFFNFVGRFYNMVVGTFGLIIPVLCYMIKGMLNKKNLFDIRFLYFYLLSIFVLSTSISSLFMIGSATSTYLFYGRYTDYILPIIILFFPVILGRSNFKTIFSSTFLIICMAFVLDIKISSEGFNSSENTSISQVASSNLYYKGNYNVYMAAMLIIGIFTFCLLLAMSEIRYKYVFLFVITLLIHLKWGYNAIMQFYKPEVMEEINQIIDVAMSLENKNITSVNVIVNLDQITGIAGKNDKYGRIIQFVNEDIEVNLITKEEMIIGQKEYCISRKQIFNEIEENNVIYANDYYILFEQ